ncbi:MAG: hypothetical protein QXQ94_11380, partial [Candidatus Bathyarchaeia archaeon]
MNSKSKELDFKSLVDPSLWRDYESFIKDIDKKLEEDIRKSIEKRKELRRQLLSDPKLRNMIRPRK